MMAVRLSAVLRVRHDGVLEALASDLDVPAAVAVARAEGRDAARYLLDVLKVRPD